MGRVTWNSKSVRSVNSSFNESIPICQGISIAGAWEPLEKTSMSWQYMKVLHCLPDILRRVLIDILAFNFKHYAQHCGKCLMDKPQCFSSTLINRQIFTNPVIANISLGCLTWWTINEIHTEKHYHFEKGNAQASLNSYNTVIWKLVTQRNFTVWYLFEKN